MIILFLCSAYRGATPYLAPAPCVAPLQHMPWQGVLKKMKYLVLSKNKLALGKPSIKKTFSY